MFNFSGLYMIYFQLQPSHFETLSCVWSLSIELTDYIMLQIMLPAIDILAHHLKSHGHKVDFHKVWEPIQWVFIIGLSHDGA
jgi:hypothetical protein